MAKKERMGSGLDALFEDNFAEEQESGGTSSLRVSMIEPDRSQPRRNFDEAALKELSENIALHGVLQPILVRPIGDGIYRIVAGERRWRAARMAGLSEIPAVIKELTDAQAAQISLIENIQRKDLDPIEEAAAYKRLMDEFGMTQEELSKTLGRSRSTIANSLRLLDLPDEIQKSVSQGAISPGHAKIIVGADKAVQQELADKAKDGFSVKQLQALAKSLKEQPTQTAKASDSPKRTEMFGTSDPFKKYIFDTESAFRDTYGIKAKVRKERTGQFTLKFSVNDESELKELIAKLTQELEKH